MSVLMAVSGVVQIAPTVFARDYDAEINAKEREAAGYNNEADRLGAVAGTLQEALKQLNNQAAAIQKNIDKSQQKYDGLVAAIEQNKRDIQTNRDALGDILADMYVDDQISPLEMLASSENIGDFIDKQEQRSNMQQALNGKINDINKLQKKLNDNKKSVELVLRDQKTQRKTLADKQAERSDLLRRTKNDQSAYKQLASKRNAEIQKLREEQRQANAQTFQGGAIPAGSRGGGGYPAIWANGPMDAMVDSWGYYSRQCTSYAAFRFAQDGKFMPTAIGNASAWASYPGAKIGSTPRAGAIGQTTAGYYGHVLYVESVNGDGTITVSDYNLMVDGKYRYYTRPAAGLTYIYSFR